MTWAARTLFCDDIRHEANGKFILIGVYAGELIVFNVPTVVGISNHIEITGLPVGKHQFSINVRFEDGRNTTPLGEIHMVSEVSDAEMPAYLLPTGLPFHIDRDGSLVLSLGVDGDELRDVGKLKVSVKKMEAAGSAA